MLSKVKKVYKEKEKVVEKPPIASFVLPPQEEKKPTVDQPTPTQMKLENKTTIN
jgi:hypothetical protein